MHLLVTGLYINKSINQSLFQAQGPYNTHTHNTVDRQNRETNIYRQKHKNFFWHWFLSFLVALRY